MNLSFGEQSESYSAPCGRWDAMQTMMSLEQQDVPIETEYNSSNGKVDTVDYVLAYMDDDNPKQSERRDSFEKDLSDQGLELRHEQNGQLCFVKIHAPQEVLCRYCEIMKLRMPIKQILEEDEQENDNDILDEARSWAANLFNFVKLDRKKFPKRNHLLACEFSRDKDYLFDIENENFFTTNVRIMIVDFILERQSAGIQRLLANGAYTAAYPLHDGTYKQRGSTRALLYDEWSSTKKWWKLQPLDTIQEYFGTKFAMYFAWLGYYTFMLIPASIAGIICFIYGWASLSSNTLAEDACSPWAENVIMCPQCDRRCDYWRLNETCLIVSATQLFDNSATMLFGLFMSVWATLYLELWHRRSEELRYHWGLVNWDVTVENPRPQYLALLVKSKKILNIKETMNPVTREKEPHVSFWRHRVPANFLSYSVVFLLIALAIAAVFAIVLYRMSMITSNILFGREIESTSYRTFALPSIAAGMNLVCILLLNYFYDWIAVYLTELEMLRTRAEFDDSLTLKIYLFQFINYYASIFYIAFLKGKFVGYPKKYNRILQYRQEECSPGGCLPELCIQLAIIMVGKQALYTTVETIWPVLLKWFALFRLHTGLKQKDPIAPRSQWIRDLKLLVWSPRGLYDEYLEMVVQFGFITLFVVAFPLAPLFALVNNVIEMRFDAAKFLRHYRRPVPRRARDIGIWKQILDSLARISIITNAFIIAFSSNFIPRLVYIYNVSSNKTDAGFLDNSLAYFNTADFGNDTAPITTMFPNVTSCRYAEYRNPPDDPLLPYKRPTLYWHILAARLAFIVVFQNVVGFITMAVQWLLSGVPRKLNDRMKREAHLTEKIIIKREGERSKDRSRASDRFATTVSNHLRQRNNAPIEEISSV